MIDERMCLLDYAALCPKGSDDVHSRNVWWLFPLNIGENWHNNHHHRPHSASTSSAWWELDLIYLGILLLEKTGLAWNVQRPGFIDSDFVKNTI